MLTTLALCASRSAQFSAPAPAVTAMGSHFNNSAFCTTGGGGFGGSVQSGTCSVTAGYTITNPTATGYTAKLSLHGVFKMNVALSSSSATVNVVGCVTGHTAPFTQHTDMTLAIVRSDGVVVSTMSSTDTPVTLASCP